jgi:hypothetical protein
MQSSRVNNEIKSFNRKPKKMVNISTYISSGYGQ